MLLVDTRNPSARAVHDAIRPHLDLAALPDDLHLIIGGDGWMLSCIHKHGPSPTYLGLNGGHLGFLHNDVRDAAVVGEKIMAGAWKAWAFPRLAMRARLVNRWHKKFVDRVLAGAELGDADLAEGFACFDTQDFNTGYQAFLAKEKPDFKGK